MGNMITSVSKKPRVLPIETNFKLPSPLPSWPKGEGFATGTINLGGLEVSQISEFNKIWATHEGGPDNLGATFFEPSPIPKGFFMLGCYAQPNNKPLSGWVLVGRDDGTDSSRGGVLKTPLDYTLVWRSESTGIKQDGNGFIWLPVPPIGYKAVGYVITASSEKPPLDKSGAFIRTLPMIANLKCRYGDMTSQIEALVEVYAPFAYFHPDEQYLPSSVGWFFGNGALLYKKGDESNPIPIDPTGSNLPQGGPNDGTYWLDLPIDNAGKEKVKKGDLSSAEAYFHIKPMLGATFTDLAVWFFYPFNGPARAKVEFVNIPLGRIGEHVGDWEHVTLRVSNFTGELWRVYFAEHSGGTWVNASEVEFQGGNKAVAYSSLHGHASYAKPGLVLQGNPKLGIGIRNDTAKSKLVLDAGSRFSIVSADYLGSAVSVPPWINFYNNWGPKISYDIAEELHKIDRLLPGKLKSAFERIVNGLPSEVLGEEGPTGPKVKDYWNGDER
ncbi:hypothetical protein Sjap_000815 [Stephania japonica]|uniref:Vacuolar protein sorting-associated protein 62 n=1 Tax=Stephania japonica TaxID=461633 RepID=A0AAP0KJS6_9MAGN